MWDNEVQVVVGVVMVELRLAQVAAARLEQGDTPHHLQPVPNLYLGMEGLH